MASHTSTLAWKIPWTEEPGGLQSMGSLRVRHNWATSLSFLCIGEGNGSPLQCSCLENPRDGGAWWAAVYGVTQSRTRLKRLSSNSSSTRITLLNTLSLFIHSFYKQCLHCTTYQTSFKIAQKWLSAYIPMIGAVCLQQTPLVSSLSFLVFPNGSLVKNLPANAGDVASIPRSGRSLGERYGNLLQYSCLGDAMNRGAWQGTIHGVTKESEMT